MRDSQRKFGPDNQTDVIWEDLVDSKTVELTANDNTVYSFVWIDTQKGPLVVEVPPKVFGLIASKPRSVRSFASLSANGIPATI
jgi:hypothetical protein